MRARLLLVLAVLGAVVVTAFAVPLALSTAEARTRELVAQRQADLQRFAGLAGDYVRTGTPGLLQEEMDAYHRLYDEGLAVVSTRGIGPYAVGAAPEDRDVAEAVSSVLRNQRSSAPEILTPWGAPDVVLAQSVGTGTQVDGAVVVVASTERARADIGGRWLLIGLGMVTALALFGFLAVWVSRWVLRPLDRLSHRFRTLAEALPLTAPPDGGGPVPDAGEAETGPPELRALSRSFSTMASAVEHSTEAQRRLTADTAHQLRNPLAALQLRLDTLEPLIPPAGRAGYSRALSESLRLQHLLRDLLALSTAELPRSSSPATDRRCLPCLVAADRVDFWSDMGRRAGVDLVAPDVEARCWAAISAEDLQQIIDVLLDNVCKYAGPGATAAVRIHHHDDPVLRAPAVTVEVADDGAGVPGEDLAQLTDRFFRSTSRTADHGAPSPGTGLGLAIVEALVTANSGRLLLVGTPGGGLTARVVLPLAPGPAEDQGDDPAEHPGEEPAEDPAGLPSGATVPRGRAERS